jgi:hypothetical protein
MLSYFGFSERDNIEKDILKKFRKRTCISKRKLVAEFRTDFAISDGDPLQTVPQA